MSTDTNVAVTNAISLKSLAEQFAIVDRELKAVEARRESLKNIIVLQMKHDHPRQEGFTYENPETGEKVQWIHQVREAIDSPKMKKLLDSDTWEMIKKETVDSKKLHAAIEIGTIKCSRIADALSYTPVEELKYIPAKT